MVEHKKQEAGEYRPGTMLERQTRARKRSNAREHHNTANNELSYRRGQNPQISPGDMAIRREKQRLMTSSGGLHPSCTDFRPDQITIYSGYLFARHV